MSTTTTTTTVGADADELERMAGSLRSAADELDGHAATVTSTVRSVAWVGGVATRFGWRWNGGHRPRIASTAQYVRDAAAQLDRNAAEQRHASAGTTGSTGSAPTGPVVGPSAPGAGGPGAAPHEAGGSNGPGGSSGSSGYTPAPPGYVTDLQLWLKGLGLAHSQIEIAVDLAERIGEHGGAGKLIEILTDDKFGAFLDGAEHVLDVGSIVVGAVTDFAEHPDLPFDERVVHALADTAVRIGLDEGMEFATEWLAGAATTALLPGFGAVLAPFVGQIAGEIASVLMNTAVDAIDGATDFVDTIADAAVAAYRSVKDVVGVVADVAEAAVEVVGGAVDLAGDAAEALADAGDAVLDAGGAVLGAGADLAGGVVGTLNPFD